MVSYVKNQSSWLENILMYSCIFIFFAIIFSIALRLFYLVLKKPRHYNFKKDGVCVIKNLLSESEIESIKNNIKAGKTMVAKEYIINSEKIRKKIRNILGPEYKFHDYIFSIKRSQIHTCHRDYNGDFFNKDQKYSSYTIIIYLENMEKCLEVIPKSHEQLYYNVINATDPTEAVLCNAGDAVLFNANIIHSGAINEKEDNMRIQMKISHRSDQDTLYFYQNYNKELDKENTTSKLSKYFIKHLSCQFPILSTFTQQYDYDVTKKEDDKSSIFSEFFYGDSQFYNLTTLK